MFKVQLKTCLEERDTFYQWVQRTIFIDSRHRARFHQISRRDRFWEAEHGGSLRMQSCFWRARGCSLRPGQTFGKYNQASFWRPPPTHRTDVRENRCQKPSALARYVSDVTFSIFDYKISTIVKVLLLYSLISDNQPACKPFTQVTWKQNHSFIKFTSYLK